MSVVYEFVSAKLLTVFAAFEYHVCRPDCVELASIWRRSLVLTLAEIRSKSPFGGSVATEDDTRGRVFIDDT